MDYANIYLSVPEFVACSAKAPNVLARQALENNLNNFMAAVSVVCLFGGHKTHSSDVGV